MNPAKSAGFPAEFRRNSQNLKHSEGIPPEPHRKSPTKTKDFFATEVANLKSKVAVPGSRRERGKIDPFFLGFAHF